jgi:hypothetical protein
VDCFVALLLAMTPKVWDHQSVIPERIEDANPE